MSTFREKKYKRTYCAKSARRNVHNLKSSLLSNLGSSLLDFIRALIYPSLRSVANWMTFSIAYNLLTRNKLTEKYITYLTNAKP